MVIITVLLMSFKWVGEMVGIKMKNLFQAGMALLGLAAVLCIAGGREAGKGCAGEQEALTVHGLEVCHLQNPLGIDEEFPVFSWQMESTRRGAAQSAYRVYVADSREHLAKGQYFWDSGKVTRAESVGITYNGQALLPRQRYFWKVEVWDENGEACISGEEAWFETGLMGEGMSGAKWISAMDTLPGERTPKSLEGYSISYQMELEETTAGFIFGAGEGRYGEFYLCEIQRQGEEASFWLKQIDCCEILWEEETDISHCISQGQSLFEVEILVEGESAQVGINGKQAWHFFIGRTSLDSIGYYKSRGSLYAWLDNILIKDLSGGVIYEEDFEGEDNIFAPYYVPVEEGRLKIGCGLMLTKGGERPAPMFRREFPVQDKEVTGARVYMTALGSFSLSINGERVSQDYFSPGKLAYNSELSYVTYDVTGLINTGEDNAVGIILLHGWYDRAVGYPEIWNPWGDKNALLGKLEITYADGSVEVIETDSSFHCCLDGPVREDDLYHGEFYDANYEKEGFDEAGFWEEGWQQAEENKVEQAYLDIPLTGKRNEPIVCVETLSPVGVTEPEENTFVYDFGQNFAGTCRIKVTGKKGQVITLRYGEEINREEMLNRDDGIGTVWTENLLTAEATDYYVLKGEEGGEVFEPEFTFHGFRYLQVTGLEEAPLAEEVEGIVLSSGLERTGEFYCSNEALNRYYQSTLWSQISNFMDNPMDCPQRDERHGWAGDAQIFSRTASYHMDTYNFYRKYLRDLRNIQSEGGSFPDMAPRNFGTEWDGKGGAISKNCWGDAAVVITWNLYTQFGDKSILEENYEALCRWVDMLEDTSEEYVRRWGGYGDHLSLEDTPSDLSDTAWCAHSADLLSRMAKALGKEEDREHYQQVFENFKMAWQRQFVLPDGKTICNTQTSYALGLEFSMFPEELREGAAGHLKLLAEYSGYHMKSGYSGIGYLLPAFSHNQMTQEAYEMLLQEEFPSLLYIVAQGATTTWESLMMGQQEEGQYRLVGSLNHYAYGTPAQWIYTDVLGIQSDESCPGFQHIILEPKPGGGLSFAKGNYTGAYGKISVEWKETEAGYEYYFEIPANTTATLILPAREEPYRINGDLAGQGESAEKAEYHLVSGSYRVN